MITFNAETKAKYVARLKEHARLDQIVQGIGFEDGRGCAVGCTLDAYNHAAYERELGIPVAFARLEDALHEGQTIELAREWPLRFLQAVPCERDIAAVLDRWFVWLLTVECPSDSGTRVAALYSRRLAGDEPSQEEWRAAEEAAVAAEGAGGAAAWAPWAAAWAAVAAAEEAAVAAAVAAERSAYQRMADKLVELLEDAGGV